jgi:hypothetical protein
VFLHMLNETLLSPIANVFYCIVRLLIWYGHGIPLIQKAVPIRLMQNRCQCTCLI